MDVSRNETAQVPLRLRYGFEWVKANETISVDLNLQDPNTAMFLELLYFT